MTTATARTPAITSRLPNVGTTIFTVISALAHQHGDRHPALHDAMDGLAEMIWHAQRYRTAPDPARYLHCLDRKLGRDPDPTVAPLPADDGPGLILPPR